VAARDVVRSPAGRLTGCLRVRRTDLPENTTLTLWYAPGVGLVQTRGEGERLTLRAGTLGARR